MRIGHFSTLVAVLALLASLAPAAPASASEAEAPDNQILVMLRLPPIHYRPQGAYGGAYDDRAGRAARQRTAQALAGDYGLKLLDDWPMPSLGVDCYLMAARDAATLEASLARLAHDPRAEWAQPVHQYNGMNHTDPLYAAQPVAAAWHLDELHRVSTGRGVRVAVVDSAIEADHPDLIGQVVLARNFVDGADSAGEVHGTAVAGIIAARADNHIGIVGVAPEARLLGLRACWEIEGRRTVCNSFTLAKALQFAIDADAQVINMSLSGPDDRLLGRLIDAAVAGGALVIGAVDPARADGGFPVDHRGVLAVAQGPPAAGSRVEATLVAPGEEVPTTTPVNRWDFVTGNSFAAAHVSGLAALMLQLRSHIAGDLAWATFPIGDGTHVAGTVDACATLARLTRDCTCSCPTADHALQ